MPDATRAWKIFSFPAVQHIASPWRDGDIILLAARRCTVNSATLPAHQGSDGLTQISPNAVHRLVQSRKQEMNAKEQQLTELLTLTSRSITHMTAAMTALSFDLLRSDDSGVRSAASKMITRLGSVSRELDQQWVLISELTGVEAPSRMDSIEEVQLHSA